MHVEDRHASNFTSKRHVCKANSSKFVLWLVCVVFVSTGTAMIVSVWTPAAAEHFKPTSSLADISLCARVCVRAEYNRRRNGVNGWTGEKRERNRAKGTRGVNYLNTITALTTSIHHLHLPSATVLSPHPGPAFPPGRPDALSSQRGPSLHWVEIRSGILNSLPFPPVRPPRPLLLPHISNSSHLRLEVSWPSLHLSPAPQERWRKSPGTPSWPLSK